MTAELATQRQVVDKSHLAKGAGERAVDDLLDRVVERINALHQRASLEAAFGIGKIIVESFYGGDLTAWRQHKAKEHSFRRLASRADVDLLVSPTTLYRAVALYDLEKRLEISKMAPLTMSHLRVVLGLPEDKQLELLARAKEEGWSADRLEREVSIVRSSIGRRVGRPARPPLLKAFRRVIASWIEVEEVLPKDPSLELSPTQMRSLYAGMEELRSRLDRMRRRIVLGTGDASSSTDADPQKSFDRVSRRL